MPDIVANGIRLHYTERGSGAETVVFSHSYLMGGEHFEPQIEALSDRYRCIAFDHRGHGKSEKPTSGYDMENLYADAEGLLDALDLGPCHFVGLSTGGFIGLRLGFRRPDLLRTLTVMDTSAQEEPLRKRLQYEAMLRVVSVTGTRPFADYVMSLFFGKKMRRDPARKQELDRWRRVLLANPAHAVVPFGRGIFSRQSVVGDLRRIAVPTLVVVGEEDRSQPVARSRLIADGIDGASLVVVPGAAHICTVDGAKFVNDALDEHLHSTGPGLRAASSG